MMFETHRLGSRAPELVSASLVGVLVLAVARVLVGTLLWAIYAGMPPVLWGKHIPEGTTLATSDILALMLSPAIWTGYVLFGSIAGALAHRFESPEDSRKRRLALFCCWTLLLVSSGWFLWVTGIIVALSGRHGALPGGDWRYGALAFLGASVEPSVTGVAILCMSRWLQSLHAPIKSLLEARW
jgi:hypothetical protein